MTTAEHEAKQTEILRDEFAMAALRVVIPLRQLDNHSAIRITSPSKETWLATKAYAIADAMMEARKR